MYDLDASDSLVGLGHDDLDVWLYRPDLRAGPITGAACGSHALDGSPSAAATMREGAEKTPIIISSLESMTRRIDVIFALRNIMMC